MRNIMVLLVLLPSLVAGCQSRSAPTAAPRSAPDPAYLSTTEVIRIAKHAAERHGVDVSSYEAADLYCEFNRKDKTWFVLLFSDSQNAMLGDHFSVLVDDRTGEARFFGGK